jgi:cystathionine beta-lyase/cystathionine gamma-synthase
MAERMPEPVPGPFTAESRLIHAGTARTASEPATPPLVPASIGVESTWERRARWPAETAPAGLIRLSVGVEPASDLITDIDQALEVL